MVTIDAQHAVFPFLFAKSAKVLESSSLQSVTCVKRKVWSLPCLIGKSENRWRVQMLMVDKEILVLAVESLFALEMDSLNTCKKQDTRSEKLKKDSKLKLKY